MNQIQSISEEFQVIIVVVNTNEVTLRRARLEPGWVTVSGSIPGARHLSRYVTSHPCQLSLAIHLWVGAMSTSQRTVTPCGWEVKAKVWFKCGWQVKLAISLLHADHN